MQGLQNMPSPAVESHFQDKPHETRLIYDKLIAMCKAIGDVFEDPKKTSIHLNRASAIAGVEVRKDYLLVNIKSAKPIKSPRINKSEQLSATRFHQKVKLSSAKEVNAELKGWLTDAYEISG